MENTSSLPTSVSAPAFGADHELQNLLAAWHAHQQLHASGAPLADLWQSRKVLDELRLELHLAA